MAEQFNSSVERFLSLAKDESNWEFSQEKRGVKVYTRTDPNSSITILKGVGTIKASPEAVVNVVADVEKRAEWDLFYDTGSFIKWYIDQDVGLAHLKFKGYGWTVWPRDFSVVAGKKKLDDGSWVTVASSTATDDEIPTPSGFVRAKIMESGFHVIPINGGAESQLTYIIQVDLAGWLPTSVTNMVNTYQPLGIIGLRKKITGSVEP